MNYIERNLKQLDISFNVLLGGELGQTFSERAAYGAGYRPQGRTGKIGLRWCIVCWFIDKLIEPFHCQNQFITDDIPITVYIRSAAFVIAIVLTGFAALKLMERII